MRFHAGRGVWNQRAIIAGTGSGKTLCGVAEDISWAMNYPGSVGFIFAPTYRMLKHFTLPTFERFLGRPFEANPQIRNYNKSDMQLEWKNGSTQWFVSLEDPEKAEGPNIDYAHIDEARLIRHFETAWMVVIRRLRGSGLCKLPFEPSVWITTTPDFPNSQLFKYVEDPKTKSPEMQIYRASIFDNITLTEKYIAEMLRTHTAGNAERFLYGRFAAVGGGSFPFDSTIHVTQVNPLALSSFRVGIDFGWTNPTAAILQGMDSDGRIFAIDEIYKRQMPTPELIEELKEWDKNFQHPPMFCDPSSPETIEMLRRAGLRAEAYKFKRDDGLRELGSRFLKAGDGHPRLFISPSCANLISELLEYKIEVKENDHAVDALRYSVKLQNRESDAWEFF